MLECRKKDVKRELEKVGLVRGEIEERRKYMNRIESDVDRLRSEMGCLEKEVNKVEGDLKEKKGKYESWVE